ncbi:MAG: hypothetical protein WCS42_27500, partial [Verrucomicrobiota bacterium]
WDTLSGMATQQSLALAAPKSTEALERIQANREKNLKIASGLQDDILDIVDKLRAGTLKGKRYFANGTAVDTETTLRDRCDLALFAKNVAEMSYRALGDVESAKNAQAGDPAASAGQILIVMPAILSQPREFGAGESVDIEAEVQLNDVQALRSAAQ